jgi:hypothetical protein
MRLDLSPEQLGQIFEASPSETTRIWMIAAQRQAGRRRPADLLAQFNRDAFVTPLFLDQRTLHRLDGCALEAAVEYEALQLSPVAPLGVCSVVAPTSQDRTLSAARGTEVVSDPTNVFALVCAQRLLAAPDRPVRLCTVHQTLRAQSVPVKTGHTRHFRLFATAEAGVATAEDGFEVEALARAIGVLDRLFDLLERDAGCHFPNRRLVVQMATPRELLAKRLLARLATQLPNVEQVIEPLESNYYDGLRFMFYAQSRAGDSIPIGDGGIFNWVSKLTSNQRFRFVASGFGLQLAPVSFAKA